MSFTHALCLPAIYFRMLTSWAASLGTTSIFLRSTTSPSSPRASPAAPRAASTSASQPHREGDELHQSFSSNVHQTPISPSAFVSHAGGHRNRTLHAFTNRLHHPVHAAEASTSTTGCCCIRTLLHHQQRRPRTRDANNNSNQHFLDVTRPSNTHVNVNTLDETLQPSVNAAASHSQTVEDRTVNFGV